MKGFRRSQSHLWKQYEDRWKSRKTNLFFWKSSSSANRFETISPFLKTNQKFRVLVRIELWLCQKAIFENKSNVELYQKQFAYKKVVPSRNHFGKDGYTPHNSTKNLMAMNINHAWKHASLYCTTRKVSFWTSFSCATQNHFVFKVERSLVNAKNTNTVENKVPLQIDVNEIIIFPNISI